MQVRFGTTKPIVVELLQNMIDAVNEQDEPIVLPIHYTRPTTNTTNKNIYNMVIEIYIDDDALTNY